MSVQEIRMSQGILIKIHPKVMQIETCIAARPKSEQPTLPIPGLALLLALVVVATAFARIATSSSSSQPLDYPTNVHVWAHVAGHIIAVTAGINQAKEDA